LPDAQILPGLNEHQGTEVMKYHAGKDAPKVDKKTALKTFFALNRRWLKGEIDSGPYETWADFQQRVRTTYKDIFAQLKGGESVALFTSGGVIATGIGIALGLSDEKILELNWQIRNSSISILKHNKGRLFLRDFNWVPHLDQEQITYV
ncbi:MAG: histidine phosphatase family protein, partial [Bacteroidota bacterium]